MDNLEQLAAQLEALAADPQAKTGYDLFAGGLRWSDEMPLFEDLRERPARQAIIGLGEFRALLYYRSSLIEALHEPPPDSNHQSIKTRHRVFSRGGRS